MTRTLVVFWIVVTAIALAHAARGAEYQLPDERRLVVVEREGLRCAVVWSDENGVGQAGSAAVSCVRVEMTPEERAERRERQAEEE